jgi:hypothetical protein
MSPNKQLHLSRFYLIFSLIVVLVGLFGIIGICMVPFSSQIRVDDILENIAIITIRACGLVGVIIIFIIPYGQRVIYWLNNYARSSTFTITSEGLIIKNGNKEELLHWNDVTEIVDGQSHLSKHFPSCFFRDATIKFDPNKSINIPCCICELHLVMDLARKGLAENKNIGLKRGYT